MIIQVRKNEGREEVSTRKKTGVKRNILSIFSTIFIIMLLIFSGPTTAVKVSLSADKQTVEAGSGTSNLITFNVTVNISSPDAYVPMEYIQFNLTGPQSETWKFNLSGTVFDGDSGKITVTPSDNFNKVWGDGYGYDNRSGYGYDFGYGYGSSGDLSINYTIVLKTSGMSAGSYSAQAFVFANSTSNTTNFASDTYNFNVTSPGTSYQPGGGGGGGGGTPTSFSAYLKDISEGGTASLDIDDEDVPYLTGLVLTAKQAIYSSTLSITDFDTKPYYSMEEPKAAVYTYFNVKYNKDNYVENAIIDFRVNTSWLVNNDIRLDTVRMYRYTTAWKELDTTFIKEDGTWSYFRADTPGFSYFSITGINGSGYTP